MKTITIIGLLLTAVGCSGLTGKTIDQQTLSALQNSSLSLIIHETPDFLAITPDKDMLSMPGFNAATADGRQMVRENRIHDPAGKICRKVARAASSEYGLSYNENLIKKSQIKAPKDLAPLANGRDYMLTVETVGWLFEYRTSNHTEFLLKYIAEARFIDAGKAAEIGDSTCEYDTLDAGAPAVNYRRLVANDAAYIKQTLDDAAAYCADKFAAELFGGRD